MLTAILLIKISPAKEQEVYNELLRISEVVDAHVVFGEYDLIAKIKTKNFTSESPSATPRIFIRNAHEYNALVQLINENTSESPSAIYGMLLHSVRTYGIPTGIP